MKPVPPDDTAHDAHLAAALRHAPDADVSAPPALGAALRQAARQAVAAGKPRPKAAPFWQAWWRRPLSLGASGAFATLLIGSVTLWIWRGEVPPPVVDMRPAHEAADAGPAAEPVAPAPAPAPAPARAKETAPKATPAPNQPPVQMAQADAAKPAVRSESGKAPDSQAARPTPPVTPPPAAAEATVVAEAPALPPAPTVEAARPAPALAAPRAVAPVAPTAEAAAAAVARSELAGASAKAHITAQLADQPTSRPRAADSLQGDRPWPDVLTAAPPGRLRLHGPQGPDAAPWLQQLRSATAGRWRAVDVADPGSAADDLPLHDDRGPVARLRLSEPGRLLICRVEPGACWQATLDDAVLRAWWAGAPR